MLHEVAFRLYKFHGGPWENVAFTTKHLLRSLPKFLFSGLCYGGSLNNKLFIRIHKDLLVFTVWPDTKRMEKTRQTVSALVLQSAVVLEQLTAAVFLPTKFDPWLSQMEWKKRLGCASSPFWTCLANTRSFYFLSFFLLGEEGQFLSWTTEVFSLCNAAEWRNPPASQ